jgi:hypothetical protein
MKILLITGAGASHNLGLNEPLPLMSNWADSLCIALDEREKSLADACLLTPGMSGPEFETNLGLLLRWEKVRYLEERFQQLGGPQAGTYSNEVVKSRRRTTERMARIMEALHVTLFREFGRRQIDEDSARAAFGQLIDLLGEPELIVATTNYDGSAEIGLSALGIDIDNGFRGLLRQTPVLEPVGMIDDREGKTPFIHLHGAVGWYENDGTVRDHNSDLDFIPSLGNPVVLYPDPDKDPTSDALVSSLWTEFESALDLVDAVLVIGHSLHDPALQRVLTATAKKKPVVIGFLNAGERNDMQSRLSDGAFVPMNFGPEIKTPVNDLLRALHTGQAPAYIEAGPSIHLS